MTAAIFAATALLGACGSAGSTGSTPVPTQPGHGGCQSGPVRVTAADDGQTLCVTTGSVVTVDLGSPVRAGSDVLEPVPGSSTDFTAEHPGTTELTAATHVCPGASPGTVRCHSMRMVRVTVTVT